MAHPIAVILRLLGIVLITILLAKLPDDVFATARTSLVVVAAAVLLVAAISVFVRPLRGAVLTLHNVPHTKEGPAIATPEELLALVRPLITAFVCLGVAIASTFLRG